MPLFNSNIVSEKQVGNLKETAIKVTRQDNKMIDPEEVRNLIHDLMKEAKKKFPNYKMRVRGLNISSWFTLKGFSDADIDLEDVDTYLHGKVSNEAKFAQFFQLEVCIIR